MNTKHTTKFKILRTLIGFNSVLWVVLGVMGLLRYQGENEEWLLKNSILMIVNAVVSGVIFFLIKKRKSWIYFIILGYFVAIMILTIADELGLYDILMGLLTLVIVISIILNRKYFIKNNQD